MRKSKISKVKTRVKPTGAKAASVEFKLSEKDKLAVLECIQRTGKLTLKIEGVGVTKVPKDQVSANIVIQD